MAGRVPAIHVFAVSKTWMPGIADKFTQSAQGRLLCPGMTPIFQLKFSQTHLETCADTASQRPFCRAQQSV